MISPELLKQYPFFGPFSETQLREIAMISDELTAVKGSILFEEGKPANELYLLIDGNVDLYYLTQEEFRQKVVKEFLVGEINPGEIFGISVLIEPFIYSASAHVSQTCKYLRIEGDELRDLLEKDTKMGCLFLRQINKVLMERLSYTRVQLAAAWS